MRKMQLLRMLSQPEKQNSHVINNLQALRIFAAMAVLLLHLGNLKNGIELHYFPGQPPLFSAFEHFGEFGVDLFFVISGFIMIVTTWKMFGEKGASRLFFVKRCIRIYPSYWLILIPLTLLFWRDSSKFTGHHAVSADLISQYLLLPQARNSLLGISWTLVYEMFFYIVFSVFVLFPRRRLGSMLLVWAAVTVAMYFLFHQSTNKYLYFLGQPLALEFMLGNIAGFAYIKRYIAFPRILFVFSLAMLAIVASLSQYFDDIQVLPRIIMFGIPACFLVYASVSVEAAGYLKAPRLLSNLGDASYALYLWHLPFLISVAQLISRAKQSSYAFHIAAVILMISGVIAYSWLVYRFFERPLTQYLNARLIRKGGPR